MAGYRRSRTIAALALLGMGTPLGAQAVDSAASAMPSTVVDTQAVDDARFINVAMGFEANFAAFMDTQRAAAESAILTEIAGDAFPRTTLEAIDQRFPGGRTGLARRFGDVLVGKFRDAAPQFLERTAVAYARHVSAADLARIRFLMEQQPVQSDVSAADDEATLQRFAAAGPAIGAEMRVFGTELGESFGVAAFAEVLQELPPGLPTNAPPAPASGP